MNATTQGSRIAQGVVVSIFFVLLVLPLVQMATGFPRVPLLNENRKRERAPRLEEIVRPAAYISQAQKWFDDHYGYRDFLIRAKTQIDYSIFGVSDKVYIGKEGWLYLRNIIDREIPAEDAMTDADLRAVVKRFLELRDILQERGITLVVVTNQLKDKFYPEFLPYTGRRKMSHRRFDDFRTALHAIPGIIYIDSTEILESLKTERQIFHKTDLHWNDPAAAEVARILVNKIAEVEHLDVPFWRYPLKIKTEKMSGGEATFMPLFYPPNEQALFVAQKFPAVPYTYEIAKPPFEYIARLVGGENLLPPAVLCGDSFSDGMVRAGLVDHFQVLYRTKSPPQDLISKLPFGVKYFIYQFIEVRLPRGLVTELGMAQPDATGKP
jgi:SGNH hydrolase-like domain, acetyltransferase AlgX